MPVVILKMRQGWTTEQKRKDSKKIRELACLDAED
jgi:hypothetical protein